MINWIQPESAPKDGKTIIGVFKSYHGYRLVCMWSAVDEQWVAATPQRSVEPDGELAYFENEWFDADDLEVWAELYDTDI